MSDRLILNAEKPIQMNVAEMQLIEGISPIVELVRGERKVTINIKDLVGLKTAEVLDGCGITGIEKIASNGQTDTYRINFTDIEPFEYELVNEANGEAYAVGKRNGVDVTEGDPAWHNNALHYANEAKASQEDIQKKLTYVECERMVLLPGTREETDAQTGETVTVPSWGLELMAPEGFEPRENDLLMVKATADIYAQANPCDYWLAFDFGQTGAYSRQILNMKTDYPVGTLLFEKNHVYPFRYRKNMNGTLMLGYGYDSINYIAGLKEMEEAARNAIQTVDQAAAASEGRINAKEAEIDALIEELGDMDARAAAVQEIVDSLDEFGNAVADITQATDGITITKLNGETSFIPIEAGSEIRNVRYDENFYLHFTDKNGEELYGGPFFIQGGGGGIGGSGITLTNVVKVTTVRNGADAIFSFTAESTDDTDITVQWYVDDVRYAAQRNVSGSSFSFNAKGRLQASDTSTVRAEMSTEGGGTLTRQWTVTSTAFSVSWSQAIEPIMLYTANEDVYVVINVEAGAETTNDITVTVGSHELTREMTGSGPLSVRLDKAWFSIGENTVTAQMASQADATDVSEEIHFTALWGYGATAPIVAFADSEMDGQQYDTMKIQYYAYDPDNEIASCTMTLSGEEARGLSVGRSIQTYRFAPAGYGEMTLTLACGTASDTIALHVTQSQYNIGMVTDDSLQYNLDPSGHTNQDNDREEFGGLTFSSGFDWVNGGFHTDADGAAAFVVKKGNRVTMPRSLFADADANGKTIDISFRIRNSDQYDAVALEDLNNGGTKGLVLKANEGNLRLNNATGQTFRYCEENRIDLSIHVEIVTNQRLSTVWLDGIPSKADAYSSGTLVQSENAAVIGSDHCDIWIYAIHIYNSALTERNMVQNYIALGPTTAIKVERFQKNNVYDQNGKITPATLHRAAPDLTIITIAVDRMTVSKKDKVPATITIQDAETVLTALRDAGAVFMVQGTSSVAYGRSSLNMDIDIKKTGQTYKLSENSIPVSYLNIKVNVASSENANNVCAVDWYNTYQPYKTEHLVRPGARDVIEGKPCAVFITNTGSTAQWFSSQLVQPGETILYCMGDLCNSKKNLEVFGQDGVATEDVPHPTRACIEVSGNDTEAQRFQATSVYYPDEGEWQTNGKTDFEWRMEPSSEDLDAVVASWNAAVAWVVETKDDPVRFKAEFGDYFAVDSMLYHYLGLEWHAAFDNVSKNTFYSLDWDPVKQKWLWNIKDAYDRDTILAYDNDGYPFGDYGLDYGDKTNGRDYFNAADNPIWQNIKIAYQSELSAMYIELRSEGAWDANGSISKWDNYQVKRPHAAMVRDAYIKYILPYKTTGVVIDGTTYGYDDNYIGRMAGSKTYQRRQFFTYQMDYMDGKYGYYSKTNSTQFRTNGDAVLKDLAIKAYAKTYITVLADDAVAGVQKVGQGQEAVFENVSMGNNTTIYVTPDRLVQYIRPLNETYNSTFAASGAAKLMEAVLGRETENLSWPAGRTVNIPSAILKELNIRGLTNFNGDLDLTPNAELETLDTRGTNAGQITLAPYAPLKSIQVNSVTGLMAKNISGAETFTMESGDRLLTVVADGCDTGITTPLAGYLIEAFRNGGNVTRQVRITDMNWSLTDEYLLEKLYNSGGIDASGETTVRAVLTGTIRVTAIGELKLAKYRAAWGEALTIIPGIVIPTYTVSFVNWDGSAVLDKTTDQPYVQYVESGEMAENPVTLGAVDEPTRATDEQYAYTYNGWSNIDEPILGDTTAVAQYTATLRTFTVTIYDGIGGLGSEIERSLEPIPYGGEYVPRNLLPKYTGLEAQGYYYVFIGFDKSMGYITEDLEVKCLWDVGRLPESPQNGGPGLSELTWGQMKAVLENNLAETYWEPKEHFSFELGRNYHFANVEDIELVSTPTYFDGNLAPMIFNGSSESRPLLKLFDGSIPRWTLALDYEFTSDAGVLLSCFSDNLSEGFQVRRTGNYVNVLWGDVNLNTGWKYQRGILTLRYDRDKDPLSIYIGYDGNTSENVYPTNTVRPESNTIELLQIRLQSTDTNAPLTIGGIGFIDGSEASGARATGWVHWCKIWLDDLGATNAKSIANFPHLTDQYNYTGIQYRKSLDSGKLVHAGFMSEGLLPLLKQQNESNTNVGGWPATRLEKWINGQYYDALPIPVQSLIVEARVRSSAGDRSTTILNDMEKVYLAAHAEAFSGQSDTTYLSEMDDGQTVVPYFRADTSVGIQANYTRIKFSGFILPDDVNFIISTTDPTLNSANTIVSEKTVWIHTGKASNGYLYVNADWCAKHKHASGRLITSTDNIDAQSMDSAGNSGGKWLMADNWWLRSPHLGSTTNFYYTSANGSNRNDSAYFGAFGLVRAFSM